METRGVESNVGVRVNCVAHSDSTSLFLTLAILPLPLSHAGVATVESAPARLLRGGVHRVPGSCSPHGLHRHNKVCPRPHEGVCVCVCVCVQCRHRDGGVDCTTH